MKTIRFILNDLMYLPNNVSKYGKLFFCKNTSCFFKTNFRRKMKRISKQRMEDESRDVNNISF